MKALKNKHLFVLSIVGLLGLVACGGGNQPKPDPDPDPKPVDPLPEKYERADDEEIYNKVFGKFAEAYEGVSKIANESERFVKYARAEAELLNTGAFVPTTTHGGAYAMNRIAPRTAPYVFFGNDSDKVKSIVMIAGEGQFIKPADREALIEMWKNAGGEEENYDAGAWLEEHGYTLGTEWATTTKAAPATMDILSTSKQADTEQMVNCIEGLIQYDKFGIMRGASAVSWEANEDSTKFTFTIREGAAWYSSDKQKVADMKADDFVAGFQHMLDTDGGLEELVSGVVKGVEGYLAGDADFSKVGVKAVAENKVEYELEHSEAYFLTRLGYSVFTPINREFCLSNGGQFGRAEWAAAQATCSFGKAGDPSSQVYNSAYVPSAWDLNDNGGHIELIRNEKYWDNANTKVTKATWNYDDGSNPTALYEATVRGEYPGTGLGESSGLLALSKQDGNFDKFAYISDTDATTFFGGLNLNRGAFDYKGGVASTQNDRNKVLTHALMNNEHFRKAILYGWDRASWNGVVRGDDLKARNLRNMYTQPDFVVLGSDVTVDGEEFTAGTTYGDLVQHFCDKIGLKVNVADGQDGWFNRENALAEMKLAKQDMSTNWPDSEKALIDIVYDGNDVVDTAQTTAFKMLLESVLGDYIQVKLVKATSSAEYYYSGYYAKDGAGLNQDIFYGSGWGPDYGDPSTYLDTFLDTGYMTKVVGLF